MATVNQMLINKGGAVYAISPDATVLDALRLMACLLYTSPSPRD